MSSLKRQVLRAVLRAQSEFSDHEPCAIERCEPYSDESGMYLAGRKRRPKKRKRPRRIWGDGKGDFQTRGRYGAVTVVG